MRALLLLLPGLALGCRQDMHDQPRLEPLEASASFEDGRGSRHPPEGTIARGEPFPDPHLHAGLQDGAPATRYPFRITADVLERGRERYGIFCSPCHDLAGTGDGTIVRRGMKRPSSFHEERLRQAPPGYYFDVITRGFGVMFDYADRIAVRDRWAIAAYIEALQLSQGATLADAPEEARSALLVEREAGG